MWQMCYFILIPRHDIWEETDDPAVRDWGCQASATRGLGCRDCGRPVPPRSDAGDQWGTRVRVQPRTEEEK